MAGLEKGHGNGGRGRGTRDMETAIYINVTMRRYRRREEWGGGEGMKKMVFRMR